MKVDLTRLDREFMTEMLVKTYQNQIDIETIVYRDYESFVKICTDGSKFFITVWEGGLIQFAYDDCNLGVISAIINRLKTCDNCSHWKNYNDMQGECDLSLRGIDGDNVDGGGKVVVYDTDLVEDRVELSCDGDVERYVYDEGDCLFSEVDLFSDIRLFFGKNFSCSRHDFKEVK